MATDLEVLVGQGLGGGCGLGAPEVGEVHAGMGGVELAGDVGVGLAVAHEEESHRRS